MGTGVARLGGNVDSVFLAAAYSGGRFGEPRVQRVAIEIPGDDVSMPKAGNQQEYGDGR